MFSVVDIAGGGTGGLATVERHQRVEEGEPIEKHGDVRQSVQVLTESEGSGSV